MSILEKHLELAFKKISSFKKLFEIIFVSKDRPPKYHVSFGKDTGEF